MLTYNVKCPVWDYCEAQNSQANIHKIVLNYQMNKKLFENYLRLKVKPIHLIICNIRGKLGYLINSLRPTNILNIVWSWMGNDDQSNCMFHCNYYIMYVLYWWKIENMQIWWRMVREPKFHHHTTLKNWERFILILRDKDFWPISVTARLI